MLGEIVQKPAAHSAINVITLSFILLRSLNPILRQLKMMKMSRNKLKMKKLF